MCHKAHDMLRKVRKRKSGGHKTVLGRLHDDDKYRKSLSDIGWTEEQIIQFDEIALEDHSYVDSWQESSRNVKSWKISLHDEGIQGPMNQYRDFKEAKQTCNRLYDEHRNHWRRKQTNPSCTTSHATAFKNTITDFNLVQDGDSILPPGRRTLLRHRIGSRAATGSQIVAGIRGKHHPGLNRIFPSFFRCVSSLAGNLISWHHIFSCTVVAQTCFYLLSECTVSHGYPCTCMAQD